MKKIVCELCEGTTFVKEGGMFVCQGCGTSYSAAEAKNMMREVDGDAPAPAPTAAPATPGFNPVQQQVDNMLVLATNAFEADNNKEAENYCNQIIALDTKCYKAWLLKGKAAGWQSTLQNQRITEAAHAFAQAIDCAPEEEKEAVKNDAIDQLKRLGIACISLRKDRFSKYPDDEELAGFTQDRKTLLDALLVLLSKGIAAGIPEGYEEEIASMMNLAAVAGFKKIREEYNNDNRPMPRDFQKTLSEADNCRQLILSAIEASDDDDEEDITRYENLVIIVEYTINMTAYPDYSSDWRSWSLTDESKATRRRWVADYKNKIARIKRNIENKKKEEVRKAEEARKARIAAYWEAHAEEKAALDSEKAELVEKNNSINSEIRNLKEQLEAIENEGKQPVPTEVETNNLKTQIAGLENRRADLGLFAGKEKKQIAEQIASLQSQIDSLKGKVAEEKKALAAQISQKAAPLKAQKHTLSGQLSSNEQRIQEINEILEADPEE